MRPDKRFALAAQIVSDIASYISTRISTEINLFPYRMGIRKVTCFRCNTAVHINQVVIGAMVKEGYIWTPRNVFNRGNVLQVPFCTSCAKQGTVFEWGKNDRTISHALMGTDPRFGKRRTDIEGKLDRL